MDKLIEFIDFSAGYGRTEVLKGINLALYAGEVTALIGKNGSGKTTLLRCAAGLMKGSGTYLRAGKKAALTAKENARFAVYLSQQGGVDLNMNVLDFMCLGCGGKKETLLKNAKAALDTFESGPFAERDYLTLSGGQKQLVRLAALLLRKGRTFILDEPDSALDIVNRAKALGAFRTYIKQTGSALLMSCHDINAALSCADRLVFLKNGRVCSDVYVQKSDMSVLQGAFDAIFPGTEIVKHRNGYILAEVGQSEA